MIIKTAFKRKAALLMKGRMFAPLKDVGEGLPCGELVESERGIFLRFQNSWRNGASEKKSGMRPRHECTEGMTPRHVAN